MHGCVCAMLLVAVTQVALIPLAAGQGSLKPTAHVSCDRPDGLTVHVNTETHNIGRVYAKSAYDTPECSMVPSGENEASLFIPFTKCGTEQDGNSYFNVIVIARTGKLVTDSDVAYMVQCSFDTEEKTVTSSSVNIGGSAVGATRLNGTGDSAEIILTIYDFKAGMTTQSLILGEKYRLDVDIDNGVKYGGIVRNCLAVGVDGARYRLLDDNGCPTEPDLFPIPQLDASFSRNGDHIYISAPFHAFKFPGSNALLFQCDVKLCAGQCEPASCDGEQSYGRKKRSVKQNNDNVSDEYTISSGFTVYDSKLQRLRRVDETTPPESRETSSVCFLIAVVLGCLFPISCVANLLLFGRDRLRRRQEKNCFCSKTAN
ncbi:PREDICTED: uncharacterized protein LOC106808476 [Priapulus caudatus]|uniref:Uncharacterized protein LOC106808476 n=1 Tax=Priapulus caudatus TaxID=37621 RepID=A0ABM1E3C6_PRICU|nr:PREDICTED: uncharacterized protein LOC106808476 [Priapulus caudatus]